MFAYSNTGEGGPREGVETLDGRVTNHEAAGRPGGNGNLEGEDGATTVGEWRSLQAPHRGLHGQSARGGAEGGCAVSIIKPAGDRIAGEADYTAVGGVHMSD